ncbi:site-specific integrase, partial [Pseudomonas sp.]|uniref:site-specific integrase n=1 Tax=Pseudomonas sp. TaxID=306 RepID=UPI00260F8813
KSSNRRSPKRICYDLLLRFGSSVDPEKSQKSARNCSRGCYGFTPENLPKGMCIRGGQFYYRRNVPKDAQGLIGRTEIWRSLRTDSLKLAVRRLSSVAAQIESVIELARSHAGLTVDETLLRPLGDDPGPRSIIATEPAKQAGPTLDQSSAIPPVSATVTLAEAYEQYLTDPTHSWSARTREAFETSRRMAVAVIGADTPIVTVSRAHCRDYIEVLRSLPRNATKRFPKLTPRQASERAREAGDHEVISAANVNVYLGNLSSFLNWAVNEELLVRNPARGLRLHDETAKKDKRFPFSPEQLRTIFNAPLYRGCVDGERGYATPGAERPRNARFWVPLIGLHAGMRLNEICQLDVTDVRSIDGIQCIVVSETSKIGSIDKILKTGASERIIPLHRNLLECGLLQYVDAQRRAGKAKLFEEIDPGTKGIRAVAFSKWFTQFLRACGAYRERTCYHSFRHNFRDELRAARIDHDIAMALGGWTRSSSMNGGASENYGLGVRIGALHEAINAIQFSGIEIGNLRDAARF